MEQDIPVGGEAAPVCAHYAAELVPAMLPEELVQWPAMVECEEGMGADYLLDQECRRADFS